MKSYRGVGALMAFALALPLAGMGGSAYPERIGVPDGFALEGIAIDGNMFYVGQRANGAIRRGDLRTGDGSLLVGAQPGRAALGMKVDQRDRLFVAGGFTGKAFVYDADTGDDIAVYQLTAASPRFVNDVVVTRTAAWFTDSLQKALYRIPIAPDGELLPAETLPLTGDIDYTEPPLVAAFGNANGIDATPEGATLVLVKTNTGKLFRVDPASGATDEIDLDGGPLTWGDGVLLDGTTLYVVRTRINRIAVVRLAPDLASGTVVGELTDGDLDVPATVAEHGDRLYLPNARFGAPATATTPYWITQVRKHSGS